MVESRPAFLSPTLALWRLGLFVFSGPSVRLTQVSQCSHALEKLGVCDWACLRLRLGLSHVSGEGGVPLTGHGCPPVESQFFIGVGCLFVDFDPATRGQNLLEGFGQQCTLRRTGMTSRKTGHAR